MSGVAWATCAIAFLVLAYAGLAVFAAVTATVVAVAAFTYGVRWQRRATRRWAGGR